jgi:adenylate cyclase
MSEVNVERRLAAILAADVVGYSRLMEFNEESSMAVLTRHRREFFDPTVAKHGGRLFKVMGDGFLVEFASVVAATQCALDIQRGMPERNEGVPPDQRIIFRIGVNLGDVMVDGSDLNGEGVNIAARLEALAEPGGICISAKVHAEVRGKLDAGFFDMGEQMLKNIAQSVRVYRLAAPRPSQATPAKPAVHDKPSIAVLPFVNISGDAEIESFADGLSEDIISALSRFKVLSVIARSSSFVYKGKAHDIKRIAAELEVGYVLEGSVRRSGNRLRVTAQLIDAITGAHLWAEKFDGPADDAFDLQDHITRSVASATDGTIFSTLERSQKSVDLIGSSAYRLAVQAVAKIIQMTPKSFDEAAVLADQAVALDPDLPYAHSLRGDVFILRLATGVIPHSPENIEAALAIATDNIRRDNMAEGAHEQMARALAAAGRFDEAVAECDVGLEINPNATWILGDKGDYLTMLGRPEEAIPICELAVRLSPRDPTAYWHENSIATAHLILGDTARALEMSRRVALRKPDHIRAGIIWASSAGLLGQMAEAQEALRNCIARAPDMTLSNVMPHFIPTFRRPQDRDLLIRGLKQARLPA